MANISAYPTVTPKGADLIVGSETYDSADASSPKGNPTRNFSVSSIVSTQISSYIVGTINKIPVFTAANKIQDSIMTETAAGGSFTGKYISFTAAGGGLSTQKLEINKALIDGAGSTGTDGFLLSSTTVGGDKEVAWINKSSFLSAYLPLAGGTVTGPVTFTSATPIILSGANPTINMGTNTGSGIITNSNASSSIQIYGPDETNFDGEIHIESSTEMNLSTAGVQRLRIKNDGQIDIITGPLEIEAGNLILEAGDLRLPADKGIYFSGQTTAAYELDYYQEGTFTPLLGGIWTSNPTNITGKFTRIGNKVTINIKWQGGAKSNVTTGYFKLLPTIPLAGELFVGSVSGANFLSFGVATISPDTTAADSAIYLSNNDFNTPAQNHFATITYLMAT